MAQPFDATQLCQVLQQTVTGTQEQIQHAQNTLSQIEGQPGYLIGMLQIVAAEPVPVPLRQSAAIYIKHAVVRLWSDRPSRQSPFAASEKQLVRDNILPIMVQAPQLIRIQTALIIKNIAEDDFPENWPTLLPQILQLVQSPDAGTVFSGLWALRMVFKKYEFKSEENRAPLFPLVDAVFPLLLQLVQRLMQQQQSLEAAEMMKLICKIFFSAVQLAIPIQLTSVEVFTPWVTFFYELLAYDIPDAVQPADEDLRAEFPWWNCKKWALHIVHRLFQSYGDPKLCSPELAHFAHFFQQACAGRLLEVIMKNVLHLRFSAHRYVPDRLILLALNYVHTAVTHAITWKAVKPELDFLVCQVLFPLMCFDDSDAELWNEDPIEYVRKLFDVIEDYYSARVAACNLLTDLVSLRTTIVLDRVMGFMSQVLQKYSSLPVGQRNFREKEGALFAIGTVWEIEKVKKRPHIAGALEGLLLHNVLPELQNPDAGFLRARACWLVGVMADVEFSNESNLHVCIQSVLNTLRDPDVPVRIFAALALRKWVEDDDCVELIRPHLQAILQNMLQLMDTLDNEELIGTLELMIDRFKPELAPYAAHLTNKLVEAFLRMFQADEDGEEGSDTSLIAVECLRAICTAIESAREQPQLWGEIGQSLQHLYASLLTEQGLDYTEELFEIVGSETFYAPAITPVMWQTFKHIVTSLHGFASDFLDHALIPLRNCIARDPQSFVSAYVQDIYQTYARYVTQAQHETDARNSTKLWEIVLHNCRGMIDQYIQPGIQIALQRLQTNIQTTALSVRLCMVICNSFYYNAALTLQVLESMGATQAVFQQWLTLMPKFKRSWEKRIAALAILSVFSVPAAQWPAIVSVRLVSSHFICCIFPHQPVCVLLDGRTTTVFYTFDFVE
eukprot:TRINITY_DN4277_c0_g1_i1.p1 TRINITY_DN4277_c0_g1~~TRINITY_DN4277_c0_g1_i1.p1  ORF type:complete len:911 (-),score=249.25 TRINITY_DN4277_c0_g1_i1:513-3209(-)